MCLIRFMFNILTLVVLFHYSNGTVYDYFNKIYKKIFAGSCHYLTTTCKYFYIIYNIISQRMLMFRHNFS